MIRMAPIAIQDFRPKNKWWSESRNSLAYRTFWESAIKGGSDFIQIITWNDFSEHTQIR